VNGPLSDQELATYARDGLLVPSTYRLPDPVLGRVRGAAETLIEETATSAPDIVFLPYLPKRDGVTGGFTAGEEIFRTAIDPTVLDVVEQVIGPDIVLWGGNLFAKRAGVGKAVQWHQEANYWPIRPLESVSVWMAIDAAAPDNGCMRYIPGSHTDGLLPHAELEEDGVLQLSIPPDAIDESRARDVICDAGQVCLLDTFIIHASNANRSGRRRAALTLRYMPAHVHYDRGNPDTIVRGGASPGYGTRPIWLVRGESRNPDNDFTIGHEHLEDYDALAEEARTAVRA
jgi:ectoine hydroxylase-related dioxygenase (phytanoyl-CoA dioxygenase family)